MNQESFTEVTVLIFLFDLISISLIVIFDSNTNHCWIA